MKTILAFLVLLSGCSYIGIEEPEIIDKILQPDYVSSSKAKKLEIPPDLSDMEVGSDVYTVPGEAKSYKDFKNQQNSTAKPAEIGIKRTDMKIIKSGALRWLVVKKDRKILWPHVMDFWEDMGFEVRKSSKRTGIMETEWIKTSDLNQNKGSALTRFDQWLDNMSGFADRRKFRTRVEPGQEPGTTEIYLSQRSAASGTMDHERILAERRGSSSTPRDKYELPEYIDDEKPKKGKIDISEERKLDDFEIDSELLTRLMIKLGASDLDAKNIVKNPTTQVHAEFITQDNGNYIKLKDPFDRSWRRLSLALDIIGFMTEDKNRSDGILYVRYKNIELPGKPEAKDKGILDSLAFWRDDNEEVIDGETGESKIDPMAPKNKKGKSVWTDEEKEAIKEAKKNKKLTNTDPMAPKNKKGRSVRADEEKEANKNKEITNTEPMAPKNKKGRSNKVKELSKISEKEEFINKKKIEKKEAWIDKFSWGSEDEKKLTEDEKRFRVRIVPLKNGAKVYIEYPDGAFNNSAEAQKILKIIYEHLK